MNMTLECVNCGDKDKRIAELEGLLRGARGVIKHAWLADDIEKIGHEQLRFMLGKIGRAWEGE